MKTKKSIVCGLLVVMFTLTLVFTGCSLLMSAINKDALDAISGTFGNTNEQSGRTASGTSNSGSPAQTTQFKFTLINDGTAYSISKGREISGAVVIPATYNGKPVTEIGSASDVWDNAAFAETSITSVTIPSSVTSIGDWAFGGTSLTNITIPSSVTSIGTGAFWGTSLTSVTIPSSVTSIGDSPFGSCVDLTGITVDSQNPAYSSVDGVLFNKNRTVLITYPAGKQGTTYTIPSSVTSIRDYAFNGCSSLTSVTIPSSVTSIGEGVFSGCTNLTSITIPSSVTSIGVGAFGWCTSLTSITIPSSVTSIGIRAFSECSSLTSITIPSSVTSIGDYAFSGCIRLTSVTIPSRVTSIGDYAFSGCRSLTGITVDSQNPAYSSVDGVLFNKNRTVLIQYPISKQERSYTIPSRVTSIGGGAFSGCTSLTNITLPSSVTSIGGSAFSHCDNLVSITIPEGVTAIGSNAFWYCRNLASITIPASVTSVGDFAFGAWLSSQIIYVQGKDQTEADKSWGVDWRMWQYYLDGSGFRYENIDARIVYQGR